MILNTAMFILLQAITTQLTSDIVDGDLIDKLDEWSAVAIVIAYLIYQLLRDRQQNKKESLKNSSSLKFRNAIYKQLDMSEKTNQRMGNYLDIITRQYTEEVSDTQMNHLVEKVLEASKYAIKSYITKIQRENHIEGNEKEIREKIKQYINNRYDTDEMVFAAYMFRGKPISLAINKEWASEMYKILTGIVLNKKSERTLHVTLTNKFDQYKNQMLLELLARKDDD